jgi:DNA-binding MarR family transcriptional regulator
MVTASRKGLVAEAEELDRDLRAIRQLLRRPVESEIARGGLTGPQVAIIRILVHGGPFSVKELSRQAGLAHSTVSGIVDRLAQRGIVERSADERDARFSQVRITAQVEEYLEKTLPAMGLHPLAEALRRARPAERELIRRGLSTLRRLLEASGK